MAGQLAVTARKSIPVENRSSRLFSAAGVGALVIATSQWAHWMGYADWDLLSLIPGFAQVTGLLPNAYADGSNFDCPNKTLGSEIALMSDDMLKTVGKTLCTKEELIAASLRAGDGQARRHALALAARPAGQPSEVLILPILPVARAPLAPLRVAQTPVHDPVSAPAARPFTLASLAPVHTDTNKDLIDEINQRARRVDSIDPCSGAMATRSAAGCGIDSVPVDGPHSGGGSSGGGSGSGPGGGSDGSHDVTEIEYEDHSGSGGGSSGSDGGEGDSGDGSHSGSGHDGGNEGDHDGGHEDGHSDGGSHDGSGEYTDNGGSHGDGDSSHDGGETADHSSDKEDEDSHSGSSTAEETHGDSGGGDYESHSGGGSESGGHDGDGESSHSGSSGGSGSDGGGHSGSGRHG